MPRIVLFFWLFVFTASSFAQNAPLTAKKTPLPPRQLHIVTTIKPLYLLTRAITGELAQTRVLLPDNADLHHYSFRPSALQTLQRADVIIRLSPYLERFLNSAIANTPATVITLEDTPGLHWLPGRGEHRHGAQHGQHTHAHETPAATRRDYHIWLNPAQAMHMADAITRQLARQDPAHAAQFVHNNQQLKSRIQQAQQQAQALLQPYRKTPYLVFHDAWHYLEQAYGLSAPRIISLHEGLPPGLGTVLELRKQIKTRQIGCLLASPGSNQRLLRTLTEGMPVNILVLSPVATGEPVADYADWMLVVARQFAQCLARTPQQSGESSLAL